MTLAQGACAWGTAAVTRAPAKRDRGTCGDPIPSSGAGRLWAVPGLGPHGRGPGHGHLPVASHQPHRGDTATSGGFVSPVPPRNEEMPLAVHVASHVPPLVGQVSEHVLEPCSTEPPGSSSCRLGVCHLCCGSVAELREPLHGVLCHEGAQGGSRTVLWHECSAATPQPEWHHTCHPSQARLSPRLSLQLLGDQLCPCCRVWLQLRDT